MMGLNFDNNGIYMGWSDLFSYNSLEEINASEELPMPQGKHYQFIQNYETADVIIGSNEANTILSEQNPVVKLHLIAQLLKRLNNETKGKQSITVYSEGLPIGVQDFLNQYLNKHENTDFGNNSDSILKNYISSNIQKLIQRLGNLADAYSPVEMDALRGMLPYTPKQALATSLTLFSPAMVPIMQNQNMTGKQGTGVAANGQKALFMWRFGTLDTLEKNPQNSKYVNFKTTIENVLGRFNYERGKTSVLIPQVIESLPYLGNVTKGLSILHPKLKSDNIGSQYISAATDNAKELILAAINSGTKLMKCHLYLLSLGFDVNDIISFMTSPAVSFVDSISDDNIFNGTQISVNKAIDFSEDYIISKIEFDSTESLQKKKEIQEKLDSYSIRGIRQPIIEAFKSKLNRVTDYKQFLSDLRSLKHILMGANEFSSFGNILGINQGIPQTKEDLVAWKNKFVTTIYTACNNHGLFSKKEGIKYCQPIYNYFKETDPSLFNEDGSFNLPVSYEKLGLAKGGKSAIEKKLTDIFYNQFQDIINFDFDRWLKDQNYRNKTSEFYNLFKQSINIFYLIDNIPHFKSMFRVANILNQIDEKISLKSQISNYFTTLLKQKYPYAPSDYADKLLPAIDEILIGHYIKSSGIQLNLKENWKILNENYKETTSSKLSLLTDHDISSFKYVFEKYIIPELQNGTLLDNAEDNEAIKNNEFIKNLMITSERGVPLYKEDINLMILDANEEVKRKYQTLLQGIKALKPYKYDGKSLVDLFMLYNMIVNKNRYGSERMTEIFEDFILDYNDDDFNSSFLVQYLVNLGEEDYNKKLKDKIISSVTLTDLLTKIAPLVGKIDDTRQEPFIKVLTPGQGYQFFEKTSRNYSRNAIDLLLPIPGELYNQTIERQVRFTEYGFGLVYSQYVSEIVNNLMSDNFEYVLDQLIQNLTVQQDINCK